MINNVVLVGRMGKAADVKTFDSGKKVARFSLALKRPTKDGDTDWIECKLWGDQVDVMQKYVDKGHKLGVMGHLEQEKWETNGEKRSKVIVNVRSIRLMEGKNDSAGGGEGGEDEENIFGGITD